MTLGFYWDKVPRCFGNPEQQMIYDNKVLEHLIRKNNGKRPCFISHNAFRLSDFGFPEEIHMSKIFAGDHDNKRKPENALLDTRKMCRFGEELNLPLSFSFSAGKGFHAYILFEPEYYKISQNLKEAIRSVQLFFRGLGEEDETHGEYKNNLRTHDPKIIGDERRLCRVWFSRYVSGSKNKNGHFEKKPYHCCPLSSDMILNWSFDKIKKYSLDPNEVEYDFSKSHRLTLKQFIKKFEVKKQKTYLTKPIINNGKIIEFKGLADDYIQHLFPDRPCVAESICGESPPHPARVLATAYLRHRLSMSQDQVFNVFQSRNWIDWKPPYTQYQIDQIYRQGYYPTSCQKIREFEGKDKICIGFEKCEEIKGKLIPNYEPYDPKEWDVNEK